MFRLKCIQCLVESRNGATRVGFRDRKAGFRNIGADAPYRSLGPRAGYPHLGFQYMKSLIEMFSGFVHDASIGIAPSIPEFLQ